MFWLSDPEYFYIATRSASELDVEDERDIFFTLETIERRITQSDYKTASIPFDPKNWITMRERRSEFARPIPDVMYQPLRWLKERITKRALDRAGMTVFRGIPFLAARPARTRRSTAES